MNLVIKENSEKSKKTRNAIKSKDSKRNTHRRPQKQLERNHHFQEKLRNIGVEAWSVGKKLARACRCMIMKSW